MQQQLLQSALDLQLTIVTVIPRLIAGLVVLLVLVLAAKLVERFLRVLLARVRFDALLAQAGLDRAMHRIGVRQSLNLVLPRLVYYLLLCLFARTAADAAGATAISVAIGGMFAFLPNVVAAVLLVVFGTSISQFAGRAVTRASEEAGIEFARPLGSVVAGVILFVVSIMAIGQLHFDTDMVRILTICSLSGLALAFGLSIGLGTRDVTRNVLAGFYARKLFRPGDPIEIRGHRGVLRGITAMQTLIDQEPGVVAVANTVFLEETVRL